MDSLIALKLQPHANYGSPDDSAAAESGNDSICRITSENNLNDEILESNSPRIRSSHDSQSLSVEACDNSFEGERKEIESLEGIENKTTNSDDSPVDEDIDLPSTVRDRKQIFMPQDLRTEDPRIYGKWLWFTNGDLCRQDYVWIELQALILNGLVILLESSTAGKCVERGRYQGVIKCYTRGDKETIKRAGLAIQNITKDNSILHYKTNQASKDSLNRSFGDRFITKYMLTASGKFYEKDELDRWKQVKDTKDEKSVFGEIGFSFPYIRDAGPLPSQEYEKRRYFYPENSNVQPFDHFWALFCNVTDFDDCGMTELDRTWIEVKKLCDEGVFTGSSCETYALFPRPPNNQLRRTITCIVSDYYNLDKLIKSGDRLRERASYNLLMYMKICLLNDEKAKRHRVKYMYTDDRDLYEYIEEDWRLIKRVW